MAATAAPALAIAFWRNALGAGFTVPASSDVRYRAELVSMTPARAIAGAALAGVRAGRALRHLGAERDDDVGRIGDRARIDADRSSRRDRARPRSRLPRLAWVGIAAGDSRAPGLITGADIGLSDRALGRRSARRARWPVRRDLRHDRRRAPASEMSNGGLHRRSATPSARRRSARGLPDRPGAARRLFGQCVAQDRARDDLRPAARAQPASTSCCARPARPWSAWRSCSRSPGAAIVATSGCISARR